MTELADHPGVRECLQFFTREKQWINEVHVQLCRVPAPTFRDAFCHFLRHELSTTLTPYKED